MDTITRFEAPIFGMSWSNPLLSPNVNAMRRMLLSCLLAASINAVPAKGVDLGFAFGFGTQGQLGFAVTTDGPGNVYICGSFSGTVDFDPGSNTYNLTTVGSAGDIDIFVAKYSPSGDLIWAKSMGGTDDQHARAIAVDGSGNVYVTGDFVGTCNFDPGPGTFNLTANSQDIFVLKLDSSGALAWARAFNSAGGTENGFSTGIASDSAGNVLVGGSYLGTFDFDPGVGTFNLSSVTHFSGFIAKLDGSGNFLWADAFTGSGSSECGGLALDAADNIYAAGHFSGTIDFDPGAGTSSVTSNGAIDAFVLTLTSSGNLNWMKSFKSEDGLSIAQCQTVAVDSFGNVLTAGVFSGKVDFDPSGAVLDITSSANNDAFVAKIDNLGNLLWAKTLVASAGASATSLKTDALNNVYLTGAFDGTLDADPGANVFTLDSAGTGGFFALKLDSSGNFAWAIGSKGGDAQAVSISLDPQGNILLTGNLAGTVNFDPNGATHNVNSSMFVAKYLQMPMLDLNGSMAGVNYDSTFTQLAGPVSIVDAAHLTVDHENKGIVTSLSAATVSITNLTDGSFEKLAADAGSTGIAISYDPTAGVLHLTGVNSLSNYEQVLRTVTYDNTAVPISTSVRIIRFIVNDSNVDSLQALAMVSMRANTPPTVSATASPTLLIEGQSCLFNCVASDADMDALTFLWNFGDGATSAEQNPSHVYAAAGTYSATVTVTDAVNSTLSAPITIQVFRDADRPSARFTTSELNGFVDRPLGFDATLCTDPANNIVSYSWDFGDGSPVGTGQLISRVYKLEGTYIVTLNIVNSLGLSDSATSTMVVLPAAQIGLFNSNIKYSVSWNRNATNADSVNLSALMNVGSLQITGTTPLTLSILDQTFSGTSTTSPRRAVEKTKDTLVKWRVVSVRKKGSPQGTYVFKATIRHASIGRAFNLAGITSTTGAISIIPVRLGIGTSNFEALITSRFRFASHGTKATGGGEGPQ